MSNGSPFQHVKDAWVREVASFSPAGASRDDHLLSGGIKILKSRRVTVVLEIPHNSALAASKRIFRRNVALLMFSAAMAVLSIWWAGDVFILRRVRAMVDASRRLSSGDLGARIGRIGVRDELSHLAGVFDEGLLQGLEIDISLEGVRGGKILGFSTG